MSAELLEQRCREIDEVQALGGWHADDEMIPTLYTLSTEELSPKAARGFEPVWRLPIRPGQQLQILAQFILSQDHARDRIEAPIRGLIWATEAWIATVRGNAEDAAVQDLIEDGENRRVRRRPDRVEARLVVGILSDETTCLLTHPRGGEVEILSDATVGEVPEGMRALMAAITHGGTYN